MTKNRHDADELSEDQVIERLKPAQNLQSIDELYSFGISLLAETRERTSRIESKAANMMVWSVALVAFIFSRVDSGKLIFHSITMPPAILAAGSAIAAMGCICSAWMVLRVRYLPVMADEQWIPSQNINNPVELRLYHVRVIHLANKLSKETANDKGVWLYRAQVCLAISGVLLGLGVIPI